MQGFPGGSAGKESACNAGDPGSNSWVRKAPWRRDRLPTPVSLGFPCGSAGKESACNAGDPGAIPWLERFPWRRESLPTLYSGREMGLQKAGHKLSEFHFHCRLSQNISMCMYVITLLISSLIEGSGF